MSENNLIDIWNFETKKLNNVLGLDITQFFFIFSRIDYFLISETMQTFVEDVKY